MELNSEVSLTENTSDLYFYAMCMRVCVPFKGMDFNQRQGIISRNSFTNECAHDLFTFSPIRCECPYEMIHSQFVSYFWSSLLMIYDDTSTVLFPESVFDPSASDLREVAKTVDEPAPNLPRAFSHEHDGFRTLQPHLDEF